jgi:hypothetical protein
MRNLALGAVLAGMSLAASVALSDVTAPRVVFSAPTPTGFEPSALTGKGAPSPDVDAPPRTIVPAATLTQVVQQYCVVCHNDVLLTGNVSLQSFDVEKAAQGAPTAERMIRKLRAGMMPPPGAPRPGGDTLLALVETLESVVDKAGSAPSNLGERRFQRLSRAEYERVVQDLLGLEVDAGRWLPADVFLESFDNMADAQAFSPTLLDSYLRAANDISRLALGNAEAVSTTVKHRNPREISQHASERLEGAPFGTRGGMVVTHDFPADGEYVFQVNTRLGDKMHEEDVDISIDGEHVATVMLEHAGGTLIAVKQTEPILVRAGQHAVSVAFIDYIDGPYEDQFRPPGWSSAAGAEASVGYGVTELAHVDELLITGPKNVAGVSETESRRKVLTCRPASPDQERVCARQILGALAAKAYRRPLREDDVADLMRFYDDGAARQDFEIGVRAGLQAILISPEFLFRLERRPAGATADASYRLSDVDLATRLSFFLWAAAPDQELIDLAASGRLSDAAVLEQQVGRMLADPRAETLATRFAHQWLRLQDVGRVWPIPFYYPDFSDQIARSMVRETELLVQHLIQEDRSLLELYTADYTFLNERLARHYGIDGVAGDEFRIVKYPNDQRRGILGHGSMLLLTSMSARTSPVLRGKWVMEVAMGTPPPPPPPNVPDFEASPAAAEGRRLTTRERMEIHRANPTCNACHRFMDPIGLALDNFDVTGRWRTRENMAPLDTRGDFYDGTSITRPSELTAVLLKRPIPLVRNFTEQLLSYGIGRPVAYYDQPTIRAITKAAEPGGYKITSLILGVVKSDVFQMRSTSTSSDGGDE